MNLLTSTVLAAASTGGGEGAPVDLTGNASNAHASGGGSLVRTIVGLAIVLAVIFALRWVLKQVKASREEKASGTGLAAMATLPLGSNRSLHVVRAGREVLVVGSGEQGVTAVRSYDEEEARRLGILEQAVEPGAAAEPGAEAATPTPSPTPQRLLNTVRAWTVRG